jgi:hypothetical protein
MKNLNTSTEASLPAFDLYEPYSGKGLYHITIKGNFKPICGHNVKYYQAVGRVIVKHDSESVYCEEPRYDERLPPLIVSYFNWQICKHCLRSLNIC